MNYCSECAGKITLEIPNGDSYERHVCIDCGIIHYLNPKIVAGAILEHEGKVLMCKRAIEPRYGLWTVPAGFMENQETVKQAAARETFEEAQALCSNLELYAVYNLAYVNQVYVLFQGTLDEPKFGAGIESLEVELMTEGDIPWNEMAFKVMTKALQRYFVDRKTGVFPAFTDDIVIEKS